MNPVLSPHALLAAAVAVLICWRVVRRVRRLIGRQAVRPTRLTLTALAFPAAVVLVALPSAANARLVEGLAAGVVIGVALGLLGLRLTRFQSWPDGHFYVPNTMLGVAISLLFVGRLAYRVGTIYLGSGHVDPSTMQSFGRSPLTLATFGIVAGYFTTFSIGVLVWHRRVRGSPGGPAPDTRAI